MIKKKLEYNCEMSELGNGCKHFTEKGMRLYTGDIADDASKELGCKKGDKVKITVELVKK